MPLNKETKPNNTWNEREKMDLFMSSKIISELIISNENSTNAILEKARVSGKRDLQGIVQESKICIMRVAAVNSCARVFNPRGEAYIS